jgi:hypothetical protein
VFTFIELKQGGNGGKPAESNSCVVPVAHWLQQSLYSLLGDYLAVDVSNTWYLYREQQLVGMMQVGMMQVDLNGFMWDDNVMTSMKMVMTTSSNHTYSQN